MEIKLPLKYLPDLKIITVAILYYIAARLGNFLVFSDTTALPAWPPSGVSFALIILLGRSAWPGIVIGALLANIMAYWNNHSLLPQTVIAISSLIAIGQALETLVGYYLIKVWIKDDYPFKVTKNTFRFLFTTLAMSAVGSTIGTLSLLVGRVILVDDIFQNIFRWWVGNAVGILLFTPFILAIANRKTKQFNLPKFIEGALSVVCMVGIFILIQFGYFSSTLVNSLPFLLIPFLLWLAFRFDLFAASTVALIASLLAIYYTIQHSGPFIQPQSTDSMLLLQIFIGVISISTIVLSATVTERMTAQAKLQSFNTNLEMMVQERTKELNTEISTRKQTEKELIKSNTELSKRNTELDNFVYSVSHDLRAPIASVLGLINLAKHDKNPNMIKLYLDKINSSAIQQDNFIKEILDQSRNSRLDIKNDEILFAPLIDETFGQLEFATATGNVVEKIVNVKQSGSFHSDRWRLKVILNNIISNAIRYRNGHDTVINIDVEIDHHKAILKIKDNGRGIGKEHLDKVYQMFYRATDDNAGSGLGLYIVKETVDKLNGLIEIESELGEGTTVRLEIPELQ